MAPKEKRGEEEIPIEIGTKERNGMGWRKRCFYPILLPPTQKGTLHAGTGEGFDAYFYEKNKILFLNG